jgi:hypothetical protein
MKKLLLVAILAAGFVCQMNAGTHVSGTKTYTLTKANHSKRGKIQPFYARTRNSKHDAGQNQTCAAVVDSTGKLFNADDANTAQSVTGYGIACKNSK